MKADYDLIAEKWSECRTELPKVDTQLLINDIGEPNETACMSMLANHA